MRTRIEILSTDLVGSGQEDIMVSDTKNDSALATGVHEIVVKLSAGSISNDEAEAELLALFVASRAAENGIEALRTHD